MCVWRGKISTPVCNLKIFWNIVLIITKFDSWSCTKSQCDWNWIFWNVNGLKNSNSKNCDQITIMNDFNIWIEDMKN